MVLSAVIQRFLHIDFIFESENNFEFSSCLSEFAISMLAKDSACIFKREIEFH